MTFAASRTPLGPGEEDGQNDALADLVRSLWAPPETSARGESLWERGLLAPLREFMSRPGKSFRARLVETGWKLSGGSLPAPAELPLLIELIHAGSLIVDDIEDDSTHRRGERSLHQIYGVPIALNLGNALYFLPQALLEQLRLPPAIELDLHRRLARMMLRSHQGQALDLDIGVDEAPRGDVPTLVARITELKTAGLMELAATVGPLARSAHPKLVDALGQFGRRLGVGLQMLNDWSDLHGRCDEHKRREDLRAGRLTWPWAWLAELGSPREFQSLLDAASNARVDAVLADQLADRMLALLESRAPAMINREFDIALSTLRAELSDDADLTDVEREIERLEASYG